MTVKQLIHKLKDTDVDLKVLVLTEGENTELEILDVREGELQDDDDAQDVVFLLA
jgi:hypothetical protein